MICPRCKHEAPFDGDPSREVLCCNECESRIAYGMLQPQVVVQPKQSDSRFVELFFDNVVHEVDRQLAHAIGINILSILPPS